MSVDTKQWTLVLDGIKTQIVESGVVADAAINYGVIAMNAVENTRTVEIIEGWNILLAALIEQPVETPVTGFFVVPIGGSKSDITLVANAAAVPAGYLGVSAGAPSDLIDGLTLFLEVGFSLMRDYALENYFKFV